MHCAGQHKPYAEWHKPCRYYRLLFRNLQVPLPISTAVFCCFRPSSPQSYGTFHRWFPPPFSVDRNAIGPFAVVFRRQASAALTAAPLGFLPAFSLFHQELPSRFSPLPLRATRMSWKIPRRRLPHFWGACAFYLLSMVSLHTKTSFLTKPHGPKLSLSSFYGLSHGTGQPLP